MKSNHMYMTLFDTPWYALVPKRIWYKPWRWNLVGIPTWFGYEENVTLASNVTYDEAIGLMKILGAANTED